MAQPLEVPMTKPINELSDIELRVAVAVEVIGIKDNFWTHSTPTILCTDEPHWPAPTTCVVPHYESSIEAAFEAIDKARTKNCYVEVIAMGWGYLITWQVFGDAPDCILDAGTIKVKFLSEVPRAICIAALTAVRARKA